MLATDEARALRGQHYNATLARVIHVHDELRIFRVLTDGGLPAFEPGQYFSLGLGYWELRTAGADEEHVDETHLRRLCRRAYSVSCSMLDEEGKLRRAAEFPYLEFYVSLVRHAARRPPSLTPRLFALQAGDRLFVERHAAGRYTLEAVQPHQDVFFFATGTGEAPHNAMIAELLTRGHAGRIVSAVGVRFRRDAAYRAVHEELARRYERYRYLVVTTREPENTDPRCPGYVGKRYLQDLVGTGLLERACGVPLAAQSAQVFLCGSPEMIGISHKSSGNAQDGEPCSMLDVLRGRGFCPGDDEHSGTVHFERYW